MKFLPDKEHFGRIFRNNAVMSSMNVPTAAVMGSCVGGAYLPTSDEVTLSIKNRKHFSIGSYLVKKPGDWRNH
jgi:acetyl-CoA carboxylase carboxyltransferase component